MRLVAYNATYNAGPKFTDDLRTILRQFSYLLQSYDNWRIHRTFWTVLRSLLDVLRQLSPHSQTGLLFLVYPKICHKIILRHHNLS